MKRVLIACITSLFLMNSTWAETNYANVAGWESCTKSVQKGPYHFSCLPPSRPANCSESSWNTLSNGNMLPWCPLCPMKPKE